MARRDAPSSTSPQRSGEGCRHSGSHCGEWPLACSDELRMDQLLVLTESPNLTASWRVQALVFRSESCVLMPSLGLPGNLIPLSKKR